MSDINEIYPESSNALKTSDVPKGQIPEYTIKSVEVKQFGETNKLCLQLDNGKSFVLNVTNAKQLAGNFADSNYNGWVGKKFKLIRTNTLFNGQSVECLRVV